MNWTYLETCETQPANVAVPLKFYEIHQNWHKSETLTGGLNQV